MADRAAFIRAWTTLAPPPLVPEIVVATASDATDLWQATEETLAAIGLPPPFWAFPWAGGQAIARWMLDRGDQVAGRTVLDLGAGGGLVAIAAAKAGAARSIAVDIDPFAETAQSLNATANGVAVERVQADIIGTPAGTGPLAGVQVLTAGDVCYESALSGRIIAWLRGLAAEGVTVLLGDPGRQFAPTDGLMPLAQYDVPTPLALEDRPVRTTGVWRVRPGSSAAQA